MRSVFLSQNASIRWSWKCDVNYLAELIAHVARYCVIKSKHAIAVSASYLLVEYDRSRLIDSFLELVVDDKTIAFEVGCFCRCIEIKHHISCFLTLLDREVLRSASFAILVVGVDVVVVFDKYLVVRVPQVVYLLVKVACLTNVFECGLLFVGVRRKHAS